ncbi:hypothetical protein TCAL_08151 [Tigriopus californicus]|uniref:DDHD domain-containing protein n=1 Tax=Tigriopus californicus TaxID=6832 RepID=A0A553P229_TIGCA|nr:phospholipase DDHD1-like isoform X2 [Tigriopus californicus]TRY71739.1 hypothetical protein TCAL_08151 [Tigriopus californicus]|eukprot:TCALIF_08151-PA protein Name:"Similar to DDHD1 Phospholipase DDHD1 (Bos taurus)" AED:0.13 eAED:0.14 QI:107/1/0.6/1/1/0.8/5/0/1068
MDFPIGGDLVNPLASQFGHLSLQDKAFLDAFNRQEQQELHGVPRPAPVDPTSLLGQLEQVTQISRLQRQGSVQSNSSGDQGPVAQPRHHEVVAELASEEIRWFFKREVDKDWAPFMGYDSLRIELRYRHIWQTKWSEVDRRTNTIDMRSRAAQPGPRGRRARSLNRVHYDRSQSALGNGYEDEDYLDDAASERVGNAGVSFSDDYPSGHNYYASSPSARQGGSGSSGYSSRGRFRSHKQYRSADNFMEDDRDMHIVVRGGVYEVDLAEWKCHSLYWPGEAFDIMRGTWFYETTWQPVQCEYADRIEQEHLQRFLGHKMADYVWDTSTSQRLEKQVHHTTSFPEFHVDWMSPEEVYLHRENTSSQIYRGISASLGFKKPTGYRLFRGYKELCQHQDRLPDITHIVFVVHGVGQVVDDTTIIRNTNIMRDNVNSIQNKHFAKQVKDTGQRIEFFPVEWRSSLRLDEGMVKHITPQRIMGLRNLLNSSAMDIMYYTSPLYRMEIWQTLQEELNRLYEMFVQRNPYFEANGGKVSIVAHSLGCVVTYDILTGWTQDVEHSWYNLQTRGGGVQDLKRSRRFRPPSAGPGSTGAQAQSGLLFRIENFFCLGSPLSVFLSLRWRDPSNQEYHDHILPRSLCKYLYNVYHPCDPVAYRVEPIFMKFYGKVEPIHLYNVMDPNKVCYSDLPLQPLQNARKEGDNATDPSSMLPVNIANGSINVSMGKLLPTQAASLPKMPSMSPSLSLPKMPSVPGVPGLSGTTTGSTTLHSSTLNNTSMGGAVNQVGQAASGMFSGVMGMVKDAASVVTPGSSTSSFPPTTRSYTTTTSTARPGMPPILPTTTRGVAQTTTSSTSGFNFRTGLSSVMSPSPPTNNNAAGTSSNSSPSPAPSYTQEMKLPDGQRLAYRMDYVLKETGNTYIAAVTSHTSYWSNPDVAYFILCKIFPELEYCNPNQSSGLPSNASSSLGSHPMGLGSHAASHHMASTSSLPNQVSASLGGGLGGGVPPMGASTHQMASQAAASSSMGMKGVPTGVQHQHLQASSQLAHHQVPPYYSVSHSSHPSSTPPSSQSHGYHHR